jgi:glycosyltransferase involved in cell wall biosynthesis
VRPQLEQRPTVQHMANDSRLHQLSVIIPVYRGEKTIRSVVEELQAFSDPQDTTNGHRFEIQEILLVHDCGPDGSPAELRALHVEYPNVRVIWLSRNFGQHAATLAGMASSTTDWIVTMDEDGQHDPETIPDMLDTALRERAAVVYADPVNTASHGVLRNAASRTAKAVFVRLLSSGDQPRFSSYRLVLGQIGRSVAAYGGSGVYLDVALGWVTQRFARCSTRLRDEGERTSGYTMRSLASHFWRLVLSSGTRPLRLVSAMGFAVALVGFIAALLVVIGRIAGVIEVEGWASLSILILVGTGLVLFSLGLVAEYVGLAAGMALGKPAFLIVDDIDVGPLGWAEAPGD